MSSKSPKLGGLEVICTPTDLASDPKRIECFALVLYACTDCGECRCDDDLPHSRLRRIGTRELGAGGQNNILNQQRHTFQLFGDDSFKIYLSTCINPEQKNFSIDVEYRVEGCLVRAWRCKIAGCGDRKTED